MASLLFVGGGTVGHIAPALSVWEQYKTLDTHSSAHFVCSPRPDDSAFLEANHLDYTIFNAPRVSVLYPIKFAKAVREAKQVLDKQKPDILFSKGGYVSLPICYEANRRGIPIILHESDTVSGYANTIVSRWATKICTGFPSSHIYTGNPVRADITNGSKAAAQNMTGFNGEKPVLLIMGGSQGARDINEAVYAMLDDLLLRCDIIHITGRGKGRIESTEHYYQTAFADDELRDFYALADIALSRAGAGSIAELAANSIPTVLVPLRGVGHDHQYKNAQVAAETGGCIHLEQSDLTKKLLPTIHNLAIDEKLRATMSKKIHTLAKPDAALQIAKIIVQTLDSSGRHQ